MELSLSNFNPRIRDTLSRAGAILVRYLGRSFSSVLGSSFRQLVSKSFQKHNMTTDLMLAGYISSSVNSCLLSSYETILVTQDSTYFNLSGHKKMEGLCALQGEILGSVQHNVLAMSPTGCPLGLLYEHNWTRGGEGLSLYGCESDKWTSGLQSVNQHLGNCGKQVVLIQDRESDILSFMALPRCKNVDLLLRVYQNRNYAYVKADSDTIVSYYAKRWGIERFHFVQKSGAYNVEKLQFDHIHTYFNALAFYSILAWKTLAINYLIREEPQEPALNIFDEKEVQTLEAIAHTKIISLQQAELVINIIAKFRPTKAQPHLGVRKMAQTIYDLQLIAFGFHINRNP